MAYVYRQILKMENNYQDKLKAREGYVTGKLSAVLGYPPDEHVSLEKIFEEVYGKPPSQEIRLYYEFILSVIGQ